MADIKKQAAPEKPKEPVQAATPEPKDKRDHHTHVRHHHDHVISPARTGTSYLNPGAIRIGR
jgi:hypothetical protein